MNKKNKSNYLFPLLIIGVAFFIIGFGVGINGIMVPILEGAFSLSKGMSYLVLTATFSAFLIFGRPSGVLIKKIGYKKSMVIALLIMALGMLLFIPSANMSATMAGFYMFLVASFIGGIGNTLLQTAVNPYVTICGPIEKAAQRMCFMGIMNKSAWYLGPIFLSLFIDVKNPLMDQAYIPFGLAAGVIILLAILIYFVSLPEVKAVGEEEDTQDADSHNEMLATNKKTSIRQFPHLILGAIALFIYVGVETLPMASAIDFSKAIGLDNPAQYSGIVSLGLVIGYIVSIFLLQVMHQKKALILFTLIALSASFCLVRIPAQQAIYCLGVLGFAHSLMWGTIWALAIDKLGKFTKSGSSILVMAIVGGAILPLVFGFILDAVKMTGMVSEAMDFQKAYWLFIPCYLYILYYAIAGHKAGLKK
ncbi:Fucose permease [Proteiniphilum saccharofermentans]|uniref:Fucose permease n=1 Tax=Proteiniphilum saccharofermentans TaxID=1642647 RepID=A0A1R3SSB3_9BACT|nr:MFS transporter [Proteiniphilum saccharofermentans]SCD19233.1 Fucose permease [Proteiniphilum saccharofermentans]